MDLVADLVYNGEKTFKVVEDYKAKGGNKKSKTIVIGFEGSFMDATSAYNAEKKQGRMPLNVNGGGLTNVCKLHLIAGGNIGNTRNYFEDQIPFYYSGVGTRGSFDESKCASQLPLLSTGHSMSYIAKMAYKDLFEVYEEGDKLFVFGFSRGASIARLFASYLDKMENKKFDYKINFLGLYDTVVFSAGISLGNNIKKLDYGSQTNSEMPDIVEKAVHFVSIDESRKVMDPTLLNKDKRGRVTEVWVPGVHSDAGGGYYHDGISDGILKCMQIEAMKAGLKCREITEETCKNEDYTLIDPEKNDWVDVDLFTMFDKDLKIEPDPLDPDIHATCNSTAMKSINRLFGYRHRKVCVMIDDKPSKEPILLLDTVVERVKNFKLDVVPSHLGPTSASTYASKKYRPMMLKGIPYKLVSSKDMSISDKVCVIEDQVDEW